jgi:hypothetical protein
MAKTSAKAPVVGYSKRSRIDKLGVKDGMRVAIIGVDDPFIRRELAERTDDVTEGRMKKDTAMLLYGVENAKGLARLPALVRNLTRNGCIWCVWTKGRKEFREDDIRNDALAHDLVDVKVMAFSETLSGLKLVIPVAKR